MGADAVDAQALHPSAHKTASRPLSRNVERNPNLEWKRRTKVLELASLLV